MIVRLRCAMVALGLIHAGPAAAASIRVCDGRLRHVDCRFQGGGRLVVDVPPDEILAYAQPTLSFTDRGRVHVVVQACEIVCEPNDSRKR